ncbi:MAG: sodium-dependent bicarbonate transport family permease, partial [Cyclobacteriaceae bacterium]|nr:sodium-dependent bicarbonate transport family permease [Cyclobacteriaceae bacterium HetDA_MAG_MS6]
PSIIIGVLLYRVFCKDDSKHVSLKSVLHHAMTNGSVLMIMGSLVIGFVASEKQAEGIKPFTTDIFMGFLAVFLLDMGMTSGRRLSSFLKQGWFPALFALIMPLVNGSLVALISGLMVNDIGDRFLFAILAASASYIAVPAAMRLAIPEANPSLYLPMALAITFPLNITIGMPLYFSLVQMF